MTTTPDTKTASQASAAPASAPASGRDLFGALRGEIDRLFDDFSWPMLGGRRRPLSLAGWMPASTAVPAMDLVERNGGYELTVELPGMSAADVELRLADGMLTLRGEKSEEAEIEKGDYHLSERRFGSFQRAVALPPGIDADKVEAKFENGVLRVLLPKTPAAKASERRIDVKAA